MKKVVTEQRRQEGEDVDEDDDDDDDIDEKVIMHYLFLRWTQQTATVSTSASSNEEKVFLYWLLRNKGATVNSVSLRKLLLSVQEIFSSGKYQKPNSENNDDEDNSETV